MPPGKVKAHRTVSAGERIALTDLDITVVSREISITCARITTHRIDTRVGTFTRVKVTFIYVCAARATQPFLTCTETGIVIAHAAICTGRIGWNKKRIFVT